MIITQLLTMELLKSICIIVKILRYVEPYQINIHGDKFKQSQLRAIKPLHFTDKSQI